MNGRNLLQNLLKFNKILSPVKRNHGCGHFMKKNFNVPEFSFPQKIIKIDGSKILPTFFKKFNFVFFFQITPDPLKPLYQYSLDRKKNRHTYTCEQNAQILLRLEKEHQRKYGSAGRLVSDF